MQSSYPLVDVHSHVYLPGYAAELRRREAAPRIIKVTNAAGGTEERLLILDGEPSAGRPVGPQYWARELKLDFMNTHDIDISIVSSANPWLDFLPASRAQALARNLNSDLEEYCATSPPARKYPQCKTLYGFGLLPLVPEIPIPALLEAVLQVKASPHLKGIIMGSRGIGKGLDDDALEPLWRAIQDAGLVVFLHPHYGIDGKSFGEKDNGHVLPLALGFPFETTLAITRLILAGVLDRYPSLRILLAHSGGTLPQLSSRLASCIDHDPVVASRLKHDARYYLGQLYFDAVAYGPEEMDFVSNVVSRSSTYERVSSRSDSQPVRQAGSERMFFGTDHPFFPPLSGSEKWRSVVENLDAIDRVAGWNDADKANVRGKSALEVFKL